MASGHAGGSQLLYQIQLGRSSPFRMRPANTKGSKPTKTSLDSTAILLTPLLVARSSRVTSATPEVPAGLPGRSGAQQRGAHLAQGLGRTIHRARPGRNRRRAAHWCWAGHSFRRGGPGGGGPEANEGKIEPPPKGCLSLLAP